MSEIHRILSHWYAQRYHDSEPDLSIERHFDGPLAWTYQDHPVYFVRIRKKTDPNKPELVLKICDTAESAEEEFRTLERLNEHSRNVDSSLGVPVPLAIFPGLPGLLMSRVTGERLTRVLWPAVRAAGRQQMETAIDAIRGAASWLAAYQKTPCHGEKVHELRGSTWLGEVRGYLRDHLDTCRRHGLNYRMVRSIGTWLDCIGDAFSDITCACVPAFDYQPTHIFVSEGKTSVIDFEDLSCGWPGENLASFLAYCQIYKTGIFRVALPLENLRSIFLGHYASQTEFGPAQMMSLEIAFLLELLETFLRPWVDEDLTWLKNKASYWRSWLAKREIIRRTTTGRWQTVLGDELGKT